MYFFLAINDLKIIDNDIVLSQTSPKGIIELLVIVKHSIRNISVELILRLDTRITPLLRFTSVHIKMIFCYVISVQSNESIYKQSMTVHSIVR